MDGLEVRRTFERLATKERAWFIKCARQYITTPDDQDIQDIIQESFLRVWKRRHLLCDRDERGIRYSLAVTIRYVSLEWLRQKRRLEEFLQIDEESLQIEPYAPALTEEHRILLDFLNQEMKKLPRKQQRAFYRLDGFSYREIASDMNISVSSATSNVSIVRDKLRAALEAVE